VTTTASGFVAWFLSVQEKARAEFGREPNVARTNQIPYLPVSLLFELMNAWIAKSKVIATIAMRPGEETLYTEVIEDSWVEDLAFWQVGLDNPRARIWEQIDEAVSDKNIGNAYKGFSLLALEEASQQQVGKKMAALFQSMTDAMNSWATSQRFVMVAGGQTLPMVPTLDSERVWTAMATAAIAIDAGSKKTVTLGDKWDAAVETAKERAVEVAHTAGRAAGEVARTAGEVAFQFLEGSGIVGIALLVGGGYLLIQGFETGAIDFSAGQPPEKPPEAL
jgi:hypothetical protein